MAVLERKNQLYHWLQIDVMADQEKRKDQKKKKNKKRMAIIILGTTEQMEKI